MQNALALADGAVALAGHHVAAAGQVGQVTDAATLTAQLPEHGCNQFHNASVNQLGHHLSVHSFSGTTIGAANMGNDWRALWLQDDTNGMTYACAVRGYSGDFSSDTIVRSMVVFGNGPPYEWGFSNGEITCRDPAIGDAPNMTVSGEPNGVTLQLVSQDGHAEPGQHVTIRYNDFQRGVHNDFQ